VTVLWLLSNFWAVLSVYGAVTAGVVWASVLWAHRLGYDRGWADGWNDRARGCHRECAGPAPAHDGADGGDAP
jgi:hypothetical protein